MIGLGIGQLGVVWAPLLQGLTELLCGCAELLHPATSHELPRLLFPSSGLWCLLASASCHAWQHPAGVGTPGPGVPCFDPGAGQVSP